MLKFFQPSHNCRGTMKMGHSRLLLFFSAALIHLVIPTTAQYCYDTGNYTSNSAYRENLNTLLASMINNTKKIMGFTIFLLVKLPTKYTWLRSVEETLRPKKLWVLQFFFWWSSRQTFLDHVHLHWVLKTYFKLFFYIKFLDFKSFKLYIVQPIEPYIQLIENVQFLGQKSLSGSILAQLMLDRSKFPRKFFIYWCCIPLDQSNFKKFFFFQVPT